MDEQYWNQKALTYKQEIFSVLEEDSQQVVVKTIKKQAKASLIAGDFGCGIGHFLPILSPLFKAVHAYDFSLNCVRQSKKRHQLLKNVTFKQADFCQANMAIDPVDFGLCVNVLMMPSIHKRQRFISNLYRSIKPGGFLLLVVPSFESYHYVNFRLHHQNIVDGISVRDSLEALKDSLPKDRKKIIDGVICIDRVETKHFLAEELRFVLTEAGFQIKNLKKIEYQWGTECDAVDCHLNKPYPWDWMVLAQKK